MDAEEVKSKLIEFLTLVRELDGQPEAHRVVRSFFSYQDSYMMEQAAILAYARVVNKKRKPKAAKS